MAAASRAQIPLHSPLMAIQQSLCSLATASIAVIVKPRDPQKDDQILAILLKAKEDIRDAANLFGRVLLGGDAYAKKAESVALRSIDFKKIIGTVYPKPQVLLERAIEKMKIVALRVGELSCSLQLKKVGSLNQLAGIIIDTANPQSDSAELLNRISSIQWIDSSDINRHFLRKTLVAIADAIGNLTGYFHSMQKSELLEAQKTKKAALNFLDKVPLASRAAIEELLKSNRLEETYHEIYQLEVEHPELCDAGVFLKDEARAQAREVYFRLEELVESRIYIMEKLGYSVINKDTVGFYLIDQADFLRNQLGLYFFEGERLDGQDVSQEVEQIHQIMANSTPKEQAVVTRGNMILQVNDSDLPDLIEEAAADAFSAYKCFEAICLLEATKRSSHGSST